MIHKFKHKFALFFLIFSLLSFIFPYNPDGMPTDFKTNKKQVVLTFDDGPSYLYTDKILDILKSNNVKASFFLIGSRMIEYPDLVRRISREGHSLGNHTYNHIRLDQYVGQRVDDEIAETSRVYENILGFVPKYFRPPGGRMNKTVLSTVASHKLIPIGWSINANDFLYRDQQLDTEMIAKKVSAVMSHIESQLKPGAVILMHNGNEVSLAVLPKVIAYIHSKGYTFVTLSQVM